MHKRTVLSRSSNLHSQMNQQNRQRGREKEDNHFADDCLMPEEGQISEDSWVAWSVTVDDVPLFSLVNHMGPLTTLAITSAQLSEHKTMGFLIR